MSTKPTHNLTSNERILKLVNDTISKRKKLQDKWTEIHNFYHGDQWGSVKTEGEAQRTVNLIRMYISVQRNLILDTRPTVQLVTYNTNNLDEVKAMNKYIANLYTNEIYMELGAVITDSLLINYGVLRISPTKDGLKFKRKDPKKVFKCKDGIIYLKDKDVIEYWTKEFIYTINGETEKKLTKVKNETGIIPFCILNFEYTTDYLDYGQSVIWDLIPLQKELNKLRSELSKLIGLGTNPPILLQEGMNVEDIQLISPEPGEVIRTNDVNGIRELYARQNQISINAIQNQINTIKAEFVELTGVSEQLLGFTSKTMSGQAIAQLLESANGRTRAKQRVLENFLKKFGKTFVEIIRATVEK